MHSFRLSHKHKNATSFMRTNLHVHPIKSSSFYCLRSSRANDQVSRFIFRLMSLLHVLINFVRPSLVFVLKIKLSHPYTHTYTCINAFKAGHTHRRRYTWLSSKHIIIIRMMDELKLVMCADRLFDGRRFRLLSHFFVQFNSTLHDIDFFSPSRNELS